MRLELLVSAACLASTVSAVGPAAPDKPARPKAKREKMADFKWHNPFKADDIDKFDVFCGAEKTFKMREYLLDDVSEDAPLGLVAYQTALKSVFGERQYPGSWDGIDPHGYDRNLLQMEYTDVPLKVREWIEEQERSSGPGKALFAVYNKPTEGTKAAATVKVPETPTPAELRADDAKKTVIFAPGALYEQLPLWVAEDSDCADLLSDLEKYTPKPSDSAVVAYPIKYSLARRSKGERDAEFTVKAQVLKAKEGETEANEEKKEEKKETETAEEPVKAEEAAKDTKDEL